MLPWPAPYPAARSCRHVLGGSEPSLAALPHGASTEYKVLTAVLKPHRIAFPRSPSCALGSSLPGKLSTLPTPPGPLHWLLPLPGPTFPQQCACPPPHRGPAWGGVSLSCPPAAYMPPVALPGGVPSAAPSLRHPQCSAPCPASGLHVSVTSLVRPRLLHGQFTSLFPVLKTVPGT